MKKIYAVIAAVIMAVSVSGCKAETPPAAAETQSVTQAASYSYEEYPLERNGISLHLDCVSEFCTPVDRMYLLNPRSLRRHLRKYRKAHGKDKQ